MADEDFSPGEIRSALERVLASPEFEASASLRDFLSHVVEETLAGRAAELKAYTIGLDALGRGEDFDAQNDPIVRVTAGKLRKALANYYATAPASEGLEITIPLGTYRPEFAPRRAENATKADAQDGQAADRVRLRGMASDELAPLNAGREPASRTGKLGAAPRRAWTAAVSVLSVLALVWTVWFFGKGRLWGDTQVGLASNSIRVMVQSPQSGTRTASETSDSGVLSIVSDLRTALSRNKSISVLLPPEEGVTRGIQYPVPGMKDFLVEAQVRPVNGRWRVSTSLINGHTNVLVWARSAEVTNPQEDRKPYDALVSQLSGELNTQIFGASIRALEGRDPKTLTAQQLFVLAGWVPGPAQSTLKWEKERVELARLARQKDPNFGPALSALSDKLSFLAAVDAVSDTPEAAREARDSAIQAMALSAGNVNVVFNVALHYWHAGDIARSVSLMLRVLELDPNHIFAQFFVAIFPYTCAPAPDETLAFAREFDRALGPDNPVRWITLTWIGWLHLNRYELDEALDAEERAAQVFQVPYTIMRRAVILNELKRHQEAADLIRNQRQAWPGLSPSHFANVTMPRLCSQIGGGEKMIEYYRNLERDMALLLENT